MGVRMLKNDAHEVIESDGKLNWNVSAKDIDEVSDDEQLSSIVRHSYITHLRRCLERNYQNWSGKTSRSEKTDEIMNRLVKVLEEEALKRCMVSSIYQKSMVKVIAEIKASTKNQVLYKSFLNDPSLKLNSKDKSVQTEQPVCQNEPEHEVKHADADLVEELMSMLMSPNDEVKKDLPIQNGNSKSIALDDTILVPDRRLSLDERLESLMESKPLVENEIKDVYFEKDVHLRRTLPSDWSAEMSVQECNLAIILEGMSSSKRILVERRFKDLFGNEDTMEFFIPSSIKNDNRRKIAGIVVKELTPFYSSKKIASRLLFKHLAKNLTSRIQKESSIIPDRAYVKKMVEDVFLKVPHIKDLKDLRII